MAFFNAFNISASGLAAQRVRMDVHAQNLANANTTRTPEGGPYRRHAVVFESVPGGQFSSQLDRAMSKIPNVGAVGQVRAHTEAGLHTSPSSMTTLGGHIGENLADANLSGGINRNTSPAGGGVRVESIQVDERPGPLMYDPSHPHANEAGYVEMPNVNIVTEMVNMMAASRAYEANITSLNTTRTLISRTLEIGQSR